MTLGLAAMPEKSRIYQLEDNRIEIDTLRVIRDGKTYSLEPRNMTLLLYLMQRPGEVVPSEELIEAVWSNRVMGENPLYKSIAAIRKALGDDTQSPRFIETIAKTGYRLLQTPRLVKQNKFNKPLYKFALTFLFLVVVLATTLVIPGFNKSSPTESSQTKIAILPFTSFMPGSTEAHFASGLSQELTYRVSKLSQIRVISQNSLMRLKESDQDTRRIRELTGVDYVLDGEIHNSGEDFFIKAFLIDTEKQEQIWTFRFESPRGNVLTLYPSIAEKVAVALKIKMNRQESLRSTKLDTSIKEAHIAYMRGRYYLNKMIREDVEKSLHEFQRAIDLDPSFARAWSGVADAYNILAELNAMPPDEAYPKARKAAEMALNLDSELAEAHAAIAVILTNFDWNWREAISHYDSAISLDPSYVQAYQARAELLRDIGQIDKAMESIEIARELDPLSPLPMLHHGLIHYLGRDHDSAITIYQQLLKTHPDFRIAHFYLALAFSTSSNPKLAFAELDKLDINGQFPDAVSLRAYVHAKIGEKDKARQLLSDLEQLSSDNYASPFLKSIVYVALGDHELALDKLEQSYQERSWMMRLLKVVPHLDPIRQETRFELLLKKMDLAG